MSKAIINKRTRSDKGQPTKRKLRRRRTPLALALTNIRHRHGFTQQALADVMGVYRFIITNIELTNFLPSTDLLIRILADLVDIRDQADVRVLIVEMQRRYLNPELLEFAAVSMRAMQ